MTVPLGEADDVRRMIASAWKQVTLMGEILAPSCRTRLKANQEPAATALLPTPKIDDVE
jgi:hypothetical protein